MQKQKKIKIAVAFHKETPIDNYIKDKNIYIPIFGGKTLYKDKSRFILDMIGDNIGEENISSLNPYLNEVTVLYWFANNLNLFENPDYIGFNHYRRFLIFDKNDLNQNTIIASKYNLTYFSIRDQLCQKETTYDDLDFYLTFLYNFLYKEYQLLKEFINSNNYYVANMFIMPKNIFEEYKRFLHLLVDASKLIIKYKPQMLENNKRVLAMLIERMTGYFIWKKEKEGVNIIDKGIVVPQSEQERFKEFYNYGNYYIIKNDEYIKVQ